VLLAVDDIRGKDREYLVALYLNARHELIEQQTVAIGKLNQIHSEPRDVLTKAMQLPCGFVIVAHNHPSGDPTASTDDILWTTRLHNACKLLGISLLDHIIVTKKGFVSLRAEGVIEDRG
jgi:DNA repair protein RadC